MHSEPTITYIVDDKVVSEWWKEGTMYWATSKDISNGITTDITETKKVEIYKNTKMTTFLAIAKDIPRITNQPVKQIITNIHVADSSIKMLRAAMLDNQQANDDLAQKTKAIKILGSFAHTISIDDSVKKVRNTGIHMSKAFDAVIADINLVINSCAASCEFVENKFEFACDLVDVVLNDLDYLTDRLADDSEIQKSKFDIYLACMKCNIQKYHVEQVLSKIKRVIKCFVEYLNNIINQATYELNITIAEQSKTNAIQLMEKIYVLDNKLTSCVIRV